MEHTIFNTGGIWKGEGEIGDDKGDRIPVKIAIDCTADSVGWKAEWTIEIQGENKKILNRTYKITPYSAGTLTSTWKGDIHEIGEFSGNLTVLRDSIVLTSEYGNGKYQAMENFIKEDEKKYRYKATFMKDDEISETWTAELIKIARQGGRHEKINRMRRIVYDGLMRNSVC